MVDLKKLTPAVQFVESSNNPDAYNKKSGAKGLMQVVDKTKDKPGFGVKGAIDDSPEERNRVGRDYLGAMVKRFGNKEDALIAYNWGPGNTRKWIAAGRDKSKLPPETRNYITKVNKQLKQRSGETKMADTSGYDRMSPKEKRSRIAQARRAIATAKSVGMKPKASDLSLVKNASKSAANPITKEEMKSDRRKAGTGALAASAVVPGALAVRAAAKGIGKLVASRTASAAAKKVAAQKAKKAAAAKAKREAAKKAQGNAGAARKAREAQGRSSAGGAADDAVAQGVSAAARKAARKKAADAARKKAAQQKKLAAQRKASANRNKVNRPPVANKKYQTNADGSLKLRNGKPILKKPTTAAKPKTPAKPKTDSKMVPTKPGRPPITKKVAKGIGGTGLGAILLSQVPSGKKEDPVVRAEGTSRKPRPVGPGRNPSKAEFSTSGTGRGAVPTRPPPPKPMKSGTGRGNMAGKNMGSQSISEYVTTPQGEKSKVRLPFGMGTVDVDTSDEGMAFEEFDQKYGGKVMTRKKGGKAKPRRRAALRGHRAEQRGG
jgi:hypothetical protein